MKKQIIIISVLCLIIFIALFLDSYMAKYGRSVLSYKTDLAHGLSLVYVNKFYISESTEGAAYLYPNETYNIDDGRSIQIRKINGYKFNESDLFIYITSVDSTLLGLKFSNQADVEQNSPEVRSFLRNSDDWINIESPSFIILYYQLIFKLLLPIVLLFIIFFVIKIFLYISHSALHSLRIK